MPAPASTRAFCVWFIGFLISVEKDPGKCLRPLHPLRQARLPRGKCQPASPDHSSLASCVPHGCTVPLFDFSTWQVIPCNQWSVPLAGARERPLAEVMLTSAWENPFPFAGRRVLEENRLIATYLLHFRLPFVLASCVDDSRGP